MEDNSRKRKNEEEELQVVIPSKKAKVESVENEESVVTLLKNLTKTIQSLESKIESLEAAQKSYETAQKSYETAQKKVTFSIGKLDSKIENMANSRFFEEMNPWLSMSETNRSKIKNLRGAIFKELRINDSTAVCWLSGTAHTTKPLKVAHILPDSTKVTVFESLMLKKEFRNDVNASKWNFMILREDIEEAFDSLKISFVPQDLLNVSNFVLKVWDARTVDPSILPLDGRSLNVPTGKSLCRRALSYQAVCAYVTAKRRNPNLDIEQPSDFSSDFEGREAVFEKLLGTLKTSVREEVREEEEEEDDE